MVSVFKIIFFYRTEIPEVLNIKAKSDGKVQIIKDGIKKYGTGQRAPRATIMAYSDTISQNETSKRFKLFTVLLDELESNNQIIGYKLV